MSLFRRKSSESTSKSEHQARFEQAAPDTAFQRAKHEFYASMGQPVVDRARFFVIIILQLIVLIIFAVAAFHFAPLKTTEPWVIYVDKDKGFVGKAEGNAQRAAEYTPERAVIEREIFGFVTRLYAMNADYPKVIQDGHVDAYAYTRGRATQEFKSFMDAEQPYQRQKSTPGLIRTVEKKTVTFGQDGKLMFIRFRTSEYNKLQTVPVMRDFLMTLQFVRDQPTDPKELDRNPLGIYVTHFETAEER